ncbi:MAG: GGDEF domain-containing phosphodiesterase [Dokdonella sp.]
MDPANQGLLLTYIAQALVGVVQVGIFAYFHRIYRQDYLRYWTWSFAALCVYQLAAGCAVYMVSVDRDNLGVRLLWSWLSQVASYLQVALLIAGSLSVGGGAGIGRRSLARVLAAAILFGTAVSLAYAFSADGADARLFLRVGLRFAISGAAFIATAVLLARRRALIPGLGLRFVMASFAAYGLMLLQESGFFALQFHHGKNIPGVEFLGLFDLVAQSCIGFGLIIWLAEDERRRADRATLDTERLRSFDATTGLPNRNHALRQIDADLGNGGSEYPLAILAIDFPELEGMAKWLGFPEVEGIALQVAQRLQDRTERVGRRLARVHAHRFMLSVPQRNDNASLIGLVQNLREDLLKPYVANASPLSIAVAIGIAVSPGDGCEAATLLQHAEAAAQGASHGLAFYSAKRDAIARHRMEFSAQVRAAFETGEFVPYFQPIVRSGSRDVVSFEVLARWNHRDRGLLLPADFLSSVEECGLLPAMDMHMLYEACAWAAPHSEAPGAPTISVNVSSHTFEQESYRDLVRETLASTGLNPHRLQIEITESTALADTVHTRNTLNALRADGVRVALDDFGVGFSSLAQLRNLPVDSLKIDRSFVQAALHDRKTAAIAESIALLARKLGLEVVAEGVENCSEADHFEKLGVTHLQGFMFSAAISGARASELVGRGLAKIAGHAEQYGIDFDIGCPSANREVGR